jgi:hypothetical protein
MLLIVFSLCDLLSLIWSTNKLSFIPTFTDGESNILFLPYIRFLILVNNIQF